MKYELETIPVWDALKENSECMLCTLEKKAENSYITFFLGNALMAPEIRVESNAKGFCARHFGRLLEGGNRLGLGLLAHTRLNTIISELEGLSGKIARSGPKKRSAMEALSVITDLLSGYESTCMVFQRVVKTLQRYAFTISYLWNRDEEFRSELLGSKGPCLHHLPLLLGIAEETLPGKKLSLFLQDFHNLTLSNLKRMSGELETFTSKYDYRASGEEWGPEKDAVPRTIQKLRGIL
jgi:hypothetical protein